MFISSKQSCVKTAGYSHPTEPQCSYDPVEGLPLAPDIDPSEKIRELEEQVGKCVARVSVLYTNSLTCCKHVNTAQLSRKLKNKKTLDDSREGSLSPGNGFTPTHQRVSSDSQSPSAGYASVPAYGSEQEHRPSTSGSIVLPHASLEMNAMSVDRLVNNVSPEQNLARSGRTDPLKSLIRTGWNPELPDPAALER
jgi:hypothetical protein